MKALHNWHTIQLDFILAFPQTPVNRVLCMMISKGFNIDGDKHRTLYYNYTRRETELLGKEKIFGK
jgi:hypothetical protein